MSRSSARCSSSWSGPIPFLAATACETYASPRFSALSSNRSASRRASSSPATLRCSRAEHGNEPAGRQGAHHLVVVILERRLGDADERPLLAQDRAVERLELRAGFDPELLDERAARVAVRGERIGLPSRPVEREHQLRAQPLPQRMPRDERLQLGHEVGVDPELEIGGDPILEHAQPQILEPMDVVLREVLQLRVGKRRASPESKRLAEHDRPPLGLFLPRLADDVLETGEIELTSVELEHIAGRPCLEETRPQQLPQLRDGVLQGRRRGSRRMLAPELIDETLSRDRLVRPQEQQRQQRALVPAAERHVAAPRRSTSSGPRILNSSTCNGCNRVHVPLKAPLRTH